MSQTQYETTIVIDSLQKSEDTQNMVTKIENFIKNNGGTITEIEEWGKKRLAYEINRKQYGNYFHIRFEGPATLPALLENEYRLQESILRYLTVKSDPRILKKRAREEEAAKSAEEDAAAETTDKTGLPDQDQAREENSSAKSGDNEDMVAETETTEEAPEKNS